MAWKLFLPSFDIVGPKLNYPSGIVEYRPNEQDEYHKLGPHMSLATGTVDVNYGCVTNDAGRPYAICTEIIAEPYSKPVVTTAAHAAEVLKVKIPTELWLHCSILDVNGSHGRYRFAVVYVWDTREVVAVEPVELYKPSNADAMLTALRKVPVKDSNAPLADYTKVINGIHMQVLQICKANLANADSNGNTAHVISMHKVNMPKPISKYVTAEVMAKDAMHSYVELLKHLPELNDMHL